MQSERVFQAVERSKNEHERFYRASAELNRALALDEVYDAAIAGARGVCEFDFAAIATYDARRGSHTLRRVVGEGADKLLGTTHKDPSSIASMAAKNKLALPAGGDWRERDVPVFSHPMRIKDYESLLVLPLIVKDEVTGTFTVAATRTGAFPSDRREMLGVIANQVAISMQNARMYEALEEQATTDGLTGLVNHRTFQERFTTMLGRAERHELSVSLLLTDIDHFKKINDSYGHPTGDEVLRRVAAILKASARKIDIVARYGGEEFALVLEGTDRAGARPAGRTHPAGGRAAELPVVQGAVQGDAVDRRGRLSLRRARQARHHRARRPGAVQRQTRRPQPHRPVQRHRPRPRQAQGRQIERKVGDSRTAK